MTVLDVLTQCRTLGVWLAPGSGDKLRLSPPGVLPGELREQVKKHKAALRQLMTAPSADVISAEPCQVCGSRERWHWLDGRLLCRVCLILDLAPLTLVRSGWSPERQLDTHADTTAA
jgi:hypothetical protein